MTADIAYYQTFTNKTYTAGEQAQLELFLEEAADVIKDFTGGDWTTPGTPGNPGSDTFTNNLQCRVVRRYFENPDNITTEGVDGYSYTRNLTTEGIELTDKEKAQLTARGIRKTTGEWGTVSFSRNRGYIW